MKILAPIDGISQVPIYSFFGADEFYCGYIPEEWITEFNVEINGKKKEDLQLSLNRREVSHANFSSKTDFVELIDAIHNKGKELYVTVNAPYYAENNYPFIIKYIEQINNYGIDGIIISDLALINVVRDKIDCKIVLSTCNQIINTAGVLLAKEAGVDRIVLPRHVSLKEVSELCKAVPDMEFECFILEGRCIYDDGNCNVLHTCGSFCTEKWYTTYYKSDGTFIKSNNLIENEENYHEYANPYISTDEVPGGWRNGGCGLCSVKFLMTIPNLVALKIVGRGISEKQKISNLTKLKKVINYKEDEANNIWVDYLAKQQPWYELCTEGYRCYFPDNKKGELTK